MPEQENPASPQQSTTTLPAKKPINWKLIGIIAVVAAIMIGGLGYAAVVLNIFDKKEAITETSNNKVSTTSATPTKKKVFPNEKWVIGDCTKPICSLYQVSSDGSVSDYPNSYSLKKDSQVLFSSEGENLIYVDGDQLIIVDFVEGADKKITSKGVKLVKVVENSFWVEDNEVYKLYDYTGKVKFSFNKSKLKPEHGFDSIDLSNYLGGSVLMFLSKGVEGGFFRELWSVSQNQEPKKVINLNFNISGTESWDLGGFTFFNDEIALLAATTSDKSPYYTVYKISSSGQKLKLFEVADTDFNFPLLSSDDSTLYYSGDEGLYEQSSVSGIYRVDLNSGKKTQIVKGNNYNASQQSFDSYNLESISPSGKNIALFDHVVSAKIPTTYTPAIFSLSSLSWAKVSGHTGGINDTRKAFGWIRTK